VPTMTEPILSCPRQSKEGEPPQAIASGGFVVLEGGTGGLWFDGTHLVDYDGVYNLPQGVIAICEAKGFNMDYAKDDNYEEMKSYRVFVTVYHSFTVEATSEEHARQEASDVIWDDHIKDCQIDVEGVDDE